MTITGIQLRDAARTFEGEPYRQDNPGRCDPHSGFKDCSGDVVAAFALCGESGVPTVSSTIARWCYENGGLITYEEALRTPGCTLIRGHNLGMEGYGNDGHIAITIGDGENVTEARGHAYGVLCDSARGRQWDAAYRFPGVDYADHPPKPKHIPKLRRHLFYRRLPLFPIRGDDVLDVQTKLQQWAFIVALGGNLALSREINIDKVGVAYGRKCAHSVAAFQMAVGIKPDAIVSEATWAALYQI